MVLENGAKFMFVLGSKSSVGKGDGEKIYRQASRRSNLVYDAKILGRKQMKYTILRASIIYGGGPGAYDFKTVHENVDESFVKGYFSEKQLDSRFQTEPDKMGCHEAYKIEVTKL